MYTVIVVVHIIVCTFLVLAVLLQHGKGAQIGAVFGSSETIFGASGPATFLSKLTTITAVVFMLTSLTLTYLAAHRGAESIMESVPSTTGETLPETTAPPAEAPQEPAEAKDGQSASQALPEENEKKAPAVTPPVQEQAGSESTQAASPSPSQAGGTDLAPSHTGGTE